MRLHICQNSSASNFIYQFTQQMSMTFDSKKHLREVVQCFEHRDNITGIELTLWARS